MDSETVQSATAFSGLMIQEPFSLDTAIFKGVLVLLLSTFMAVSAISFLRFRLQRKEADFQRLVQLLDIEQSEAQFSVRRVSEEYAARDYWLPVTFSTIVCMGGFFAVLFGADLVSLNIGRANMLLTGVFERSTKIEMQALRWQSQLVMSVAFLGAFVFSAQRIIRRLITGDLTPNVYYSVAIRMIFASIIALLLSLFLEASPIQDYSRETLPVVAFLVGVTPENALVFLREKFGFLMNKGAKQAHDLPLDMIEGMNMFYKLRVAEVGIDNAQNLAEANLIELLLKTPISAGNLIDWIAQARLYVYLKDDIESLRKLGIRSAFDFYALCDEPERLAEIAAASGIPMVKLEIVCARLTADRSLKQIISYREVLTGERPPLRGSSVTAPGAAAGVNRVSVPSMPEEQSTDERETPERTGERVVVTA